MIQLKVMLDDIRPPGPPKTKTKKPKEVSKPEPKAHMPKPEITIDLADKNPKISSEPSRLAKMIRPHKHWYTMGKGDKITAVVGALLVVIGLGACVYFVFINKPKAILANNITHVKAAPVTVPAPLTGLPIDPSLAKRPVTGIMIENSLDARPQSGLQDAGVVYEAIAEAGITRFLALFQDTQPQYIGPVRSLRPYYIDFATPYDASIAHVGGSPDALSQIRSGGKDLDQFFNSGAYWRQSTRPAPHNVYTSFERLDGLNAKKGYTSSTVQSWPRKKDQKLKVPTAKTIDLAISSASYNPHYDYDPTTNSYARSEDGAAHMNLVNAADKTGVQLKPKVVIVPVLPLTNGELDASGAYYSDYTTTGSGTVYIFQDGGVTTGTWEKGDRTTQFIFKDANGQPIKLDAGQTWVSVVSAPTKVSYKP